MPTDKNIALLTLYVRLFHSVWKKDGFFAIIDHLKFFIKTQTQQCFKKRKFKNQKIIFISECPGNSMRYRCHHVVEQLAKIGIKSTAYEISQVDFQSCVNASDVIILHRVLHSKKREKVIKLSQKKGKIFIFDTDDLVFNLKKVDSIKKLPKIQFEFLLGAFERLQKMLKICDYAIGSTDKMKIELEKFLPKKCFIHQNMMADGEFIKLQNHKTRPQKKMNIILGYASGTRTHDDDFQEIEKSLLQILKKYPKVKLKIIGHLNLSPKFGKFKNQVTKKRYIHWKKLPAELIQFDINLAPLESIDLNEAKSDLKFFEAATVAIPTIATNIGAFSKNIIDGKTGFLANNENEWFDKIEQLILNPTLRKQVGYNAFEYVKKERNSVMGTQNFQRILKVILQKRTS